ncbi:MAG: hypothetical protein Q8K60_04285, partial [Parachlamydiaceae bacterium]|nr:hypothetical protein [Parachlamydiaceae bacterium]
MTVTINLRKKIIKFFSFSYILFGLIFSSYLSAHVEDYDDENIEQYEEELDEIVTSINGIEYCRCFSHCSCFGHFTDQPIQGVFHQECFAAPIMPMNKVWHEFLVGILRAKQAGPYFIMDNSYLKRVVRQHNDFWGVIHTIPDYLYIIDFFRDRIYQVKIDKINSIKKSYTSSDEKEKLINEINKIEQEYQNANQILDRIPSVIIPLYQKAINICHHKLPAVSYHKGLMHSLNGDWYEALLEIQNFFELTDEKLKYTNLEPLLFFGEACLELHLYQDAITALTTVI